MPYQSIHNPVINDVQKQYIKYRQAGKSRAVAVQLIRSDFANELQDEDDRLAVLVGLFLVLYKKNELFEAVVSETLDEIQHKLQSDMLNSATYTLLMKVVQCAKKENMYGEEAAYKRKSSYLPNWNIGDTFFHTINYPTAESLGIKGWCIILHKVGEYLDEFGLMHHLMLISLAQPNQLPKCYNDLINLGFLPMIRLGKKIEYLAQITIKSKKEEMGYELTPIGCFPRLNISGPDNYEDENPLTAMPLFGKTKPGDRFPGFEDQICRLYKRHGKFLGNNSK